MKGGETMEYMTQLNRFFEKAEADDLPASAQIVYLHLLNINNRLHWCEWFKVANSRLENLTKLKSNNSIVSAKNRLKQANLLDFKSEGKVTTRYKIIPIPAQDTAQDTAQLKRQDKTRQKEREKTPAQTKTDYAENVSLTADEYSKLVEHFNGREDIVRWCIDTLNDYKGASGKKYKSDYYAIRKWVIAEYEKKRDEALAKRKSSLVGDDYTFENFGKGIAS